MGNDCRGFTLTLPDLSSMSPLVHLCVLFHGFMHVIDFIFLGRSIPDHGDCFPAHLLGDHILCRLRKAETMAHRGRGPLSPDHLRSGEFMSKLNKIHEGLIQT